MEPASRELPVHFTIAGLTHPSETRLTRAGAYVLVFETAVPAPVVALTMISSYTGMPGADTVVAHAAAAAGAAPRTWSRHVSEEHLPTWRSRHRCLLDHLAAAQDVLTELGLLAKVELGTNLPLMLITD